MPGLLEVQDEATLVGEVDLARVLVVGDALKDVQRRDGGGQFRITGGPAEERQPPIGGDRGLHAALLG